ITLVLGRQADVLPASGPPMERVARVLGYPPESVADLVADWRRSSARAGSAVSALFLRERTSGFG
nr:hypothetical protein [Micromonospora sp. DSM 115978]